MTNDSDDLRTAAEVRKAFGSITLDRSADEVTARAPSYVEAVVPLRPRRGRTILGVAAGVALLAGVTAMALAHSQKDGSGRHPVVGSRPDRGSTRQRCEDRTRNHDPGAGLRYLPSRIPQRYQPDVSALNVSDMCERVEAVLVTATGGRIANSIRVVTTNQFTVHSDGRKRLNVPGFQSAVAYPGAYPSLQLEARGPDGTVRVAIDGDGAVATADLIAVARALHVDDGRVALDRSRVPPPYFVAGTAQPGQPVGGVTWSLAREDDSAFGLEVDTSYPGDPALFTHLLPRDPAARVVTVRGHRSVFRPPAANGGHSELEWFEAPGVHVTMSAAEADLATMTEIADSMRLVPIDDPGLPPTA